MRQKSRPLWLLPETFKQELKKLNRDNTYLVYCRSGHRSAKASGMMKKLDFRTVYNMLGGIIYVKGNVPELVYSRKRGAEFSEKKKVENLQRLPEKNLQVVSRFL